MPSILVQGRWLCISRLLQSPLLLISSYTHYIPLDCVGRIALLQGSTRTSWAFGASCASASLHCTSIGFFRITWIFIALLLIGGKASRSYRHPNIRQIIGQLRIAVLVVCEAFESSNPLYRAYFSCGFASRAPYEVPSSQVRIIPLDSRND